MSFLEFEYTSWIRTTSGISQKGQNDVISRLRRADRIAPIDQFKSVDDHHNAMRSSQAWDLIPRKSQESVIAASRRYFRWLKTKNQ